ncbi:SdpI family protein [Clostridium sp.]|uniref:SdpI family protein n=1 Tax=Clostridium sp. TaxID=1506 RepID=UPI003F3594A1
MSIKKLDLTQWLIIIASAIIIVLGIIKGDSSLMSAIFCAIIIGVLIIVDIKAPTIGNIDKDNPKVKSMRFMNRFTMILIVVISIVMTFFPEGISEEGTSGIVLVGITSVIMMILGNKLPQLPMNRNIGFRLPWIIRNEVVWNKTHRFMGITSFVFAILQFILVFFVKSEVAASIGILGWIGLGTIYSLYIYYKQFN